MEVKVASQQHHQWQHSRDFAVSGQASKSRRTENSRRLNAEGGTKAMSRFLSNRIPSEVFRSIPRDEWVVFAHEAGEQHEPYMDQMSDDERLTIMESSPTARAKYGLVDDRAF